MAISRMQEPQQIQRGLGSLQDPRQNYGLGKLVKKAVRGVKKIVKSPLGKAAIIGGLGMIPFGGVSTWGRLGGIMKGLGAKSMIGQGPLHGVSGTGGGGFKGFASKWLNPFNKKNPLLYTNNKFSGKKAFGLGAGAMMAAPFIQSALKMGPYQEEGEEEEVDWTQTPSSISNILSMAKAQDPSLRFMPSPDYVKSGFYNVADGGRVGLLNGGEAGEAQMEQMLRAEYIKYRNQGGTMPYEQFKILVMKQAQQGQTPNQMMAAGGRTGYYGGELVEQQTDFIQGPQGGEEFQETVVEGQEQPSREQLEALAMEIFNLPVDELDEDQLLVVYQEAMQGQPMEEAVQEQDVQFAANGGRMDDDEDELTYNPYQAMSMYKRPRRQEGGMMDLGGQEKDYRDNGGFVALGGEERADDVPARLSKNEFVFTADAVRNAGGGDIDRGSEVMQNVMDNLEQGGEVSEDSQGLQGGEEIMSEEIIDESNPAQGMYDNYEQLQSRVA